MGLADTPTRKALILNLSIYTGAKIIFVQVNPSPIGTLFNLGSLRELYCFV
jgi:hypothetical protein